MKIRERNIEKLNSEMKKYEQVKLKFLRNFGEYTEKEIDTFWKNFYKKQLDIMLSIVLYYYKKNELKSSTNPFIQIEDIKDAKKYMKMISEELGKMDLEKISQDIILQEQYEELKIMIEKMKDKYIFSQKFWYLFMEFYIRYIKLIEEEENKKG